MNKSIRKCLWCNRSYPQTAFNKDAHILPQSLGGRLLSNNECDDCNISYGQKDKDAPAIDEVLKEAFNISRYRMLNSVTGYYKINNLPRFKSIYFKVDLKRRKVSLKPAFRLKPNFQALLCRQFKRGLYKVALETLHENEKIGFNSEFDFVREYSRFNFGDYPVFYLKKSVGSVLTTPELILHPRVTQYKVTDEIRKVFGFYEIEVLGHTFILPLLETNNSISQPYLKNISNRWYRSAQSVVRLKYLTQIDLALKVMNR